MVALYVCTDASKQEFQVWPDATSIPVGFIHENGQYLLVARGLADPYRTELYVDDVKLEALRPPDAQSARWRWNPGFYAGSIEMCLELSHRRHVFEVVTDPELHKLTRDEFARQVSEILEDTFALFSLSSFRTGIGRGHGRKPPAIARLEYLRSRLPALVEAVAAIARNPQRRLRRIETTLPYHAVTRATGVQLLRSFRSGRLRRQQGNGPPLPSALRGYLPQAIRTLRGRSDVDIREHREIKTSLCAWRGWLAATAELLRLSSRTTGDEQFRWARRVQGMMKQLDDLLHLPLFQEISDATARVLVSPLYRRNPAYRAFFQIHKDFQRGIARVFGDFLNVPLSRTFDLYELWCFLRLLRAAHESGLADATEVAAALGQRTIGAGVELNPGPVTVPLRNGMTLSFQTTFREYWKEELGRGSFSRPVRPDFSLVCGPSRGAPLIVLDAKYRIDNSLSESLSSIHMYRDAIVEADAGGIRGLVKGAYLLSPHLPVIDASWQQQPLPGRLFHPAYRSGFRFGAITMRPGMSLAEIADALRLVLDNAASDTERSSSLA